MSRHIVPPRIHPRRAASRRRNAIRRIDPPCPGFTRDQHRSPGSPRSPPTMTRRCDESSARAREIAADETSRDGIDAPSWEPSVRPPRTERGTGERTLRNGNTTGCAGATPPTTKEAATQPRRTPLLADLDALLRA